MPIGKADIKREGRDITLITWSKNLFLTEKVANELQTEGISAEIIDLRTLKPLDKEAILNSVRKTNKVVIIQEQHEMASYGSYLSHFIQREAFDFLDAPVGLVSTEEVPLPYSKALEEVILPSVERCVKEVKEIMNGCQF